MFQKIMYSATGTNPNPNSLAMVSPAPGHTSGVFAYSTVCVSPMTVPSASCVYVMRTPAGITAGSDRSHMDTSMRRTPVQAPTNLLLPQMWITRSGKSIRTVKSTASML